MKKLKSVVLVVLALIGAAGIYSTTGNSDMPKLLSSLQSPFKPLVFRWHLLLGANPDEQSALGQTALMEASSLCSLAYVKLLLEAGANPNMQNVNGETALMQIGSNGSDDAYMIGYELIHAGAKLNVVSDQGMTALENAQRLGDTKLIMLIGAALPNENF